MFDKNIEQNCAYCKYGYLLSNDDQVICKKYGFLFRQFHCRKFKYDPLKRIPAKKPMVEQFENFDLTL